MKLLFCTVDEVAMQLPFMVTLKYLIGHSSSSFCYRVRPKRATPRDGVFSFYKWMEMAYLLKVTANYIRVAKINGYFLALCLYILREYAILQSIKQLNYP